ncbi:hypothetical protein EV426DRAFT_615910 [Tirmania nivea]|nr:hypothetical protein EV426DRAFT_615910 [Tirmania nivea]
MRSYILFGFRTPCQAKDIPPPSASPKSSTLSSLLRRRPSISKKLPRQFSTKRSKMENSDEGHYSRRDSQQAPPAYDEKVAPPVGGSRTNSYPHGLSVENQQLPEKVQTRKRSPSRVAINALKGIFMMGGDKESKNLTNSSRSPPPSPGHVGSEQAGITLNGVNIIGTLTIQAVGIPQVMPTHQELSSGITPRSGAPSSSAAYPSTHPSQRVSPRGTVQAPDGYFPSATTLASDHELHALKDFDTQFLIDDSGSMRLSTSAVAEGKTHWEEVNHVLSNIVRICAEFDENGVDVFFLNSSLVGQFNRTNIKDPNEVMELFEARYQAGIRGSTPTAEALDLIIAPYLKECEHHAEDRQFPKPKNIIVMTDGAANNNKLLKQNLIGYAKRLDRIKAPPHQVGVQFFQVGNVEGVEEFLAYLDNALSEENECRDFIDTKSSEDMGPEGLTARRVLTTVLGGVNRRLDNAMI